MLDIPEFDTDSFLEHHGIKGMRWGKRKSSTSEPKERAKKVTESRSIRLKNGDTLTLSGERTPATARVIARLSPSTRKRLNDNHSFRLKDKDGKDVGEMFFYKKKPNELNVMWVEVEDEHRGKGIATAAMRSAIDFAKENKLEKVTLEVPGISPDARHIYEGLGFKAGRQITKRDMWGGLTEMELDLKGVKSA